ncbi:GDCCVxC domain-containing (seleno)protein [Peloplasma aerotolerans]|uniref:GDCCVxC domain-containing (Seleno)protein n=1 Tax=Peloplasma aerotolerans TaxID=3044389 RepID=A0AAW6UA96_9MOLU|nr:GDCCVxC domain-containing (seleno)protein [Mariniplasma sp. M4Ah]MDI6452854.1 GDCCVxC domain-containing (seleno)protein [Mariniplasma sp. M4Ah]
MLKCPYCGNKENLIMPSDACQYLYECPNCNKIIAPKTGDCCVFCSYGSNPCPPVQLSDKQ